MVIGALPAALVTLLATHERSAELRLKPAVSPEEALQYLSLNATLVWGVDHAAKMAPQLKSIADAMAVVSALDIPEDVEPLFGEDGAKDPVL